VERTSSRAGFAPAEVQRLSRRTVYANHGAETPRNDLGMIDLHYCQSYDSIWGGGS